MGHDRKVTELYLQAENLIEYEDVFWEGVVREYSYYENYDTPLDCKELEKGREIGEFDVFLYNTEEEVGLYLEVKPHKGEFNYADKQIERADNFFEDWDIYGQKYTYRR